MRRKKSKFLSLILIALMLITVPTVPHHEVSAAYIGNDGAIPAGGTAGKGGGICSATIYRIGITSESMSPRNEFMDDDSLDIIKEKLLDHYKTHMPRLENSIMFVPSSCYTTNAAIAWYQASSGDLIVQRRNITGVSQEEIDQRRRNHDAKVRHLTPVNSDPGHLFLDGLLEKQPNNKPGDFSNLVSGKWKDVIKLDPDGSKSKKVWDYLFGRKEDIQARIKNYIGEDQMDNDRSSEDHHEGRLKFVDLLMTLYAMSPPGEQKIFYEKAIERFLSGENLSEKPIVFAVDTAVRFSSPAQLGDSYVYIPSTSYVEWMHGGTPTWSITNPDFTTSTFSHDTLALIKLAAEKSIEQKPNLPRKTSQPSDTDGYTWGYSGVVGQILKTDGYVRWVNSSVVGVMESLRFHENAIGFNIAGGPHNKPQDDPECDCGVTVTIDKEGVEGVLESNPVGKYLPMTISIKENDPKKLEDWEKLLDGATDLQIKVRLWRSQAPGSPIWERITGPEPATDENPDHWVNIEPEELLRYISKGEKMSYQDDLTEYEIPYEHNQLFKYNAQIFIRGVSERGNPFDTQCIDKVSKEMYIKGPPEPGEKGYYSSFPEYWSEIKQGSPGNETFEAMAGTPTTRSLYYATGGSEFIVDIEVEYVPDMTSTRTYRSYFTGGVPSEFKEGDQAGDYTVPSPSGASSSSLNVNAHQGGTVTATWTGTTPYIGDLSWGDHYQSGSDKWDDGPYEQAKAQAEAWISTLNSFTIEHTAASDGETRKFNSWGASITTDTNTHPAGSVNIGQVEIPPVPCSGDPCSGGSPGQPYIPTTGKQGTDGQYSITVTASIPARIIDGPSSIYDLPMIQDTWTQTITYDYMKINKLKVWEIHQAKVDGMRVITGTEEITASVVQGDPTVFYNIAQEGQLKERASAEGRLRYTLEPDQHDVVVWNEGPRTNKDDGRGNNGWISGPGQEAADWATGIIYTDTTYSDMPNYHEGKATAKDKLTDEYAKFDERRKTLTEVTAISDFIILQTSSGDQSVMYFEKTSEGIEAQKQVDIPKTSFEEQWTNNPLSAANWEANHIHVGSYNGDYASPNTKYNTLGTDRVETVFDRLPAGMQRTARPNAPLRLVKTDIDVIDTLRNGEYTTGHSHVFYKTIINEGPEETTFPTGYNERFKDMGVDFQAAYSKFHSKVNDIVIHNPVSTEFAIVLPLEAKRDQRTAATKVIGGNLQQPTYDYERRLKPGYVFEPVPPTYETRIVPNPNYEPAKPSEKITFNYSGTSQLFEAPADGEYTLEAWGAQGGSVQSAVEYKWYNEWHGETLWYPSDADYTWTYCPNHPSTFTGETRGGRMTSGGQGGYAKGTVTLKKGDILHIHVGGEGGHSSSSSTASGGWNGGGHGYYHAGGGGGASDIRLGGQALHHRILVAGGGGGAQAMPNSDHRATGGHGGGLVGGDGHTHGYWSTQYQAKGGTQTSGGAPVGHVEYEWYNEAHNVYLWYPSNVGYENTYCGAHHPSYPTGRTRPASSGQGNAGSLGQGGSYSTSYQGGGGGGYYGGSSGAYHGYSGAGGSGYIDGVENGVMSSGVRSGNGLITITTPYVPAKGSPTMERRILVSPGISEPPEDAYEYVRVEYDPAAPVTTPTGTYAPGNFINLDYGFQIYFPNRGNFYGNGAHGLHSNSAIPGKGFTDNMPTSEWTAAKQVKFEFFVIHDGRTYSPGNWIDLDPQQEIFDFYLPLANNEAISAKVEFRAIANNAPYADGELPLNKTRYQLAAKHSGNKSWNIDIVGRIGSFVIEDTGDFRFSNLFKLPLEPTQWLVPNVVKKVNPNQQHRIVGDTIDVRGEPATTGPYYLDTYGKLPHLRQSPLPMPLSPSLNNVTSLQRQPMRLGYNVFADVQTLGNYYNRLQIIPYYYSLNLQNGEIIQVDIYMDVDGVMKPINIFGLVEPGWDTSKVHQYIYSLDWTNEAGRRNYFESALTEQVVADNTFIDDRDIETTIGKPYGNQYPFGTAQVMFLSERNRTFMGTDRTNGIDHNPGGFIPSVLYGKQGQRWHFTYGLPSSAVAIEHDQPITQTNIDKIRNNNHVLIAALDIKAVGDTYVLQYSRDNSKIFIADREWDLSSIPHPIVSVFSANRSSADDLTISGTH